VAARAAGSGSVPTPAAARAGSPVRTAVPAATVEAVTTRTGGLPLHRRAYEEVAAALPRANSSNTAHGTKGMKSANGANGGDGPEFSPVVTRQARPPAASGRAVPAQRSSTTVKASATPVGGNGRSSGDGAGRRTEKKETAGRARRSPAETIALAERLKADRPALTDAEIAAELGITTQRLRTVRREAQAGDHTLAA
jgi:hypothetical protein